jgi:hypothetical protein
MHPFIRIFVAAAALAGVALIGTVLGPAVSLNLTAARSWTRTQGTVSAMNGAIEFELGAEPDTVRALANVDHTWGLKLFKKVPLFADPADPARVKPAGFLQMWLAPVEMSGLILLLLALALRAATLGRRNSPDPAGAWTLTPSPGPLPGGVSLHSPARQWKIVLGWSLLGVVMVIASAFAPERRQPAGMCYMAVGAAFAISLWIFSWHTRTLELSANREGIRMTSVLGWRHIPWSMIRGVESQDLFTTYYNGKMRMWELPFPGSTIHVLAFMGERGHTVLSFSPELEPKGDLKELLDLCTQQTGARVEHRDIRLPW